MWHWLSELWLECHRERSLSSVPQQCRHVCVGESWKKMGRAIEAAGRGARSWLMCPSAAEHGLCLGLCWLFDWPGALFSGHEWARKGQVDYHTATDETGNLLTCQQLGKHSHKEATFSLPGNHAAHKHRGLFTPAERAAIILCCFYYNHYFCLSLKWAEFLHKQPTEPPLSQRCAVWLDRMFAEILMHRYSCNNVSVWAHCPHVCTHGEGSKLQISTDVT